MANQRKFSIVDESCVSVFENCLERVNSNEKYGNVNRVFLRLSNVLNLNYLLSTKSIVSTLMGFQFFEDE